MRFSSCSNHPNDKTTQVFDALCYFEVMFSVDNNGRVSSCLCSRQATDDNIYLTINPDHGEKISDNVVKWYGVARSCFIRSVHHNVISKFWEFSFTLQYPLCLQWVFVSSFYYSSIGYIAKFLYFPLST